VAQIGKENPATGKVIQLPFDMYTISTYENHIQVNFEADFTNQSIKTIIHHETTMPEYSWMNDIWLIGKHRSLIAMDDLESMASDFNCMCPKGASRKKTAVVVEQGLTEAIVLLWIKTLESKVPFELQVFHTLKEAEAWLGIPDSKVA
jgi:hypothetical protein